MNIEPQRKLPELISPAGATLETHRLIKVGLHDDGMGLTYLLVPMDFDLQKLEDAGHAVEEVEEGSEVYEQVRRHLMLTSFDEGREVPPMPDISIPELRSAIGNRVAAGVQSGELRKLNRKERRALAKRKKR